MKPEFRPLWFAVTLWLAAAWPAQVQAQDILTVRSSLGFDQAISFLQNNIESHGYSVSLVQRCDRGLNNSGHETDLYRVIFLGKRDEIRRLSKQHPELIPYLPLKIAIFAEGQHTILSTINPAALDTLFDDETLRDQFRRWEADLRSILYEVQMSRDESLLTRDIARLELLN